MHKTDKKILVLGLGGAGCRSLAQIARRAPAEMRMAVMDCDVQTLDDCTGVETRLEAGISLTDARSTGGDVETGRRCAENAAERIEGVLSGVDLVMVIVGLGGGFGTGAAPVVARLARAGGTTTLFFAIRPFPFEGPALQNKAQRALRQLRTYSDAIIEMPNDRIQPDGDAPLETSLENGCRVLAAGTAGLWRLLMTPGICNIDYASLHAMLRSCDAFCRFSCATASAEEDRVDALIQTLRDHPLADGGSIFDSAAGLLIGIIGGDDLTLTEVRQVVEAIAPADEDVWLRTGVALDSAFTGRLFALVLTAEAWTEPLADDGRSPSAVGADNPRQGELAGMLRPRSRLFSGAERTVWKGEDLDVPAYLRRGIKLPR